MTSTIRLRNIELAKYMGLKGIDTKRELAHLIGVDESTVSRILLGQMAPGAKFIAGLVAAFRPQLDFDDLFEVVTDVAA